MENNLLFTKQHKNITKMVDGPISWDEGAHLAYLASLIPHGGTIVEIGSNVGRSACYMGHGLVHAHKTSAHIYCIDLWSLGGETQQTNYHDPKGLRHQKFKDNIKAFGLSAIVSDYEAESVKFAKFNWNKSIDLLFIDAGHTYEAVSADYHAWKDFVRVGGFIAFHDYMDMWPGIVKLLDNEVFPDPM
jgi:predicted O-methyltransferase YrrM